MTEFEGVVPALEQALKKREYTVLTPVQSAVLAPGLEERDLLVSAQTGSGKTVAFGIALAPTLLNQDGRFDPSGAPTALAVAPTRELALQVKRELEWLYEMTGASLASCVGGMDMRTERRALERGANIVVGTPGRLRDHIERGSLDTNALRAVVLDEADEMLDLGFREDLEFILDAAPTERRTLMFSATVPRQIANLAKRYQKDAERITTNREREQHHDIEYRALLAAPNDRENAIINVLRHADARSAIVFCATRATVNHMTSRFINRGFSVVALSGELSQNERTHALQALRDGRAWICIATDVAARGIDLPNLELVIHADLPKNQESLLHRSGRTGRAGRKGVSTLIVPHHRRRHMECMLYGANISAHWGKPPSAEEIIARDRERILEDEALSGEMTEEEETFAGELLARYTPERIATAFLRQHMAGLTAPEELLDSAPEPAKRTRREDFKDGVWFRLSVGRERNAEPRWLLPMMCRFGKLTKNEIGAIRIQRNESFVELAGASADRFMETIGPSRKLENSITVTRLDGLPPEADRGPVRRRGDKPRHEEPRAETPRAEESIPKTPAVAATSSQPAATPTETSTEFSAAPTPDTPPSPSRQDAEISKPGGKPARRPKNPPISGTRPVAAPTRKQRRQAMAAERAALASPSPSPSDAMPGEPAIVKERALGLTAPVIEDRLDPENREERGPRSRKSFTKKRRGTTGSEKPRKKKLNKKAKLRKLKAAMAPKGRSKSSREKAPKEKASQG